MMQAREHPRTVECIVFLPAADGTMGSGSRSEWLAAFRRRSLRTPHCHVLVMFWRRIDERKNKCSPATTTMMQDD